MHLCRAVVLLLSLLIFTTSFAMTPEADDVALIKRIEKEMQEACHSSAKLVMDWAAFEQMPKACEEMHVALPRMCHNLVETVAALCKEATPRTRYGPYLLSTMAKLTEFRCTIDSTHEQLAKKWFTEHPDTSGSKCPRDVAWNDQGKYEVFKDQGERKGALIDRPHGAISVEGATMRFAYTFETEADYRGLLERELTRLAGGESSSSQGLADERPAVGLARTRARSLKDGVLFEIRERYPDLPNQLRFKKHQTVTGPPKLLLFSLSGKEIAQETLDESGNVTRTTGKIPDGPARKYFETGSSTNPIVEIEITYKDNQRTAYKSNVEKGSYVDGKRDGIWTFPQKLVEKTFERGVLMVVKTHWISTALEKRPQGAISTEETYKNGKPGKTKYYNYEGTLISAKQWAVLDDPLLALPHGKIVNKNGLPNLEKCRANLDCMSGRCYFKTDTARIGVCLAEEGKRPDRGPSHDCNKDSECLSGFCTSALCE